MPRFSAVALAFSCNFKSISMSKLYCLSSYFIAAALVGAARISCLHAEPPSFTLEALVSEALEKNPELKFYEAEIASARGERIQIGTLPNPVLSADLGGKTVSDLGGKTLGTGPIWAVSVAQTFEFPGRVSLRKAIADRQIGLAKLGLEQFRAALANKIRQLGFHAMAAEQRAEASAEVAARFRDLLAVLVQRDPAGIAPLIDTRIIEASELTLEQRAGETERERQAALFELNQLRGVPIAAPMQIERTPLHLEPPPDLAQLMASAQERNFAARTRIAELEQQGFKVRLAVNERMPAVTVAPYFAGEQASDQQRAWGLGIVLPLPLWDQKRGSIEAAKARQTQAEVALTVTLRETERAVAVAEHNYRTQLDEMSRWRGDEIQRFREAAALGDLHYRLGALPIATYTELQKQYLDALDAVLSTQLNALSSRSELEFLVGQPLKDVANAKTSPAPSVAGRQKKGGRS
jgi:cobalt-zinc-cadmium efflux system outer membrane protein